MLCVIYIIINPIIFHIIYFTSLLLQKIKKKFTEPNFQTATSSGLLKCRSWRHDVVYRNKDGKRAPRFYLMTLRSSRQTKPPSSLPPWTFSNRNSVRNSMINKEQLITRKKVNFIVYFENKYDT